MSVSMSISSKKTISKAVYVNMLAACRTSLKDEFMKRGGWELIFTWTIIAIFERNDELVKEILKLLLNTPVSLSRLKSNWFIAYFRALSVESEDKEVRSLCKQVLSLWRKFARAEENGVKFIFWEDKPQQAIPAKEGSHFGGETSMTAGEAAAPSPLAVAKGGDQSVKRSQNNLAEWQKTPTEVVTSEDNHMTSKAIQKEGPHPYQASDLTNRITQLGAQDDVGAVGGQVKKLKSLKKERKLVIPVKKMPVEIPKKYSRMLSLKKKDGKDNKSRYLEHPSSPSAKMTKSSMRSGSGIPISVSKVTQAVQDKKDKSKEEKMRRQKEQSEQAKEDLKNFIWMPPRGSSLLGWKIPKKKLPNLEKSIPVTAMPPKNQTRRKKPEEVEEKLGATKKAKLEQEKEALVNIPKQPSQISKSREKIKKLGAAVVVVERKFRGEKSGFKKALKSCLAVKRLGNGPKKCVSWKAPLQEFDDDHLRSNGCGGNTNHPDYSRIGANGLLRKKKRCEILCRYFKKGNCSYATRCKFLHAASASISSPAASGQSGQSFPSSQSSDSHNDNSGNRSNNRLHSPSKITPFEEDWNFDSPTDSAQQSPTQKEKQICNKVKHPPKDKIISYGY